MVRYIFQYVRFNRFNPPHEFGLLKQEPLGVRRHLPGERHGMLWSSPDQFFKIGNPQVNSFKIELIYET